MLGDSIDHHHRPRPGYWVWQEFSRPGTSLMKRETQYGARFQMLLPLLRRQECKSFLGHKSIMLCQLPNLNLNVDHLAFIVTCTHTELCPMGAFGTGPATTGRSRARGFCPSELVVQRRSVEESMFGVRCSSQIEAETGAQNEYAAKIDVQEMLNENVPPKRPEGRQADGSPAAQSHPENQVDELATAMARAASLEIELGVCPSSNGRLFQELALRRFADAELRILLLQCKAGGVCGRVTRLCAKPRLSSHVTERSLVRNVLAPARPFSQARSFRATHSPQQAVMTETSTRCSTAGCALCLSWNSGLAADGPPV